MFKKRSYILLLASSIFVSGNLLAATFPVFEGDSSASFSAVNATVGVQSLSWGASANPFGGQQSSLTYAGDNPFSINNSNPFKIGSLTYDNTTIITGTGIGSADMTVNLDFSSPIIDSFVFNYNLLIANTTNIGSSSSSADTVTINPASGFNPFLTTLDGIDYYFTVLGFELTTGNYVNSFTQAEGSNTEAALYARITAVNPVPEPAILWLMLSAFSGLIWLNGRKKAYI
ncbi:MAG: hypothetical protein GQ532_21580 [Methylomarinum sp.]|nr:hypothetical protein [Methylomarinum sp.]